MAEKSVSLRRSDMTEGGLLDNVDVTWSELEFVMWDYNGNVAEDVPALKISMVEDGSDAVDQYFSCGKATDWKPSKDGKRLVAIGNASGINKTSKLGILIDSLIEAGFPEDKISDDCSVFVGLKCHMIRKEDIQRKGLVDRPRADGKTFKRENLIVDSIIKLPWDKKTGGANSGGNAKAAAASTESGDDNSVDAIWTEAVEIVSGILESTPRMTKKALVQAVFKNTKTNPNKSAIWQLVSKEDFLASGPWDTNEKEIFVE